jgi:hypothetical protein
MKSYSIFAALISVVAAIPFLQLQSGPNILTPTHQSQYYVSTGKIDYNTGVGLISKDGLTSDITTLLTFTFPAAAVGKTAVVHFALDFAGSTKVTGTGQLDLFSSIQPATASTLTWPPGNQRNNYLGRFQAAKGATATWLSGSPVTFTITTAGNFGYELVGVGDKDLVAYSSNNNGIWISYI